MRPLKLTAESLIPADGPSAHFAVLSHANIALAPDSVLQMPAAAPRLVCWSGWLAADADPARGAFPRDFRVWTRAGWDALNAACDAILPRLGERGTELCLRPHARHVLSDPQACLSFLRHRPGVRLLLDSASFMTGSMLSSAEDHLARVFESLGSHDATLAVLLANVDRHDPSDPDALVPAPLHRGLIDPRLILDAWRAHCPPQLPVALLGSDFDAQAALLAQP